MYIGIVMENMKGNCHYESIGCRNRQKKSIIRKTKESIVPEVIVIALVLIRTKMPEDWKICWKRRSIGMKMKLHN